MRSTPCCRHVLPVVLAGLLVLAACSSDDDGEGAASDTTEDTVSETSGDTTGGETGEDAAAGGATDVGVTDDTIKVGVFLADAEALEAVGIDGSARANETEMWAAAFAAINDRGGINDRMVEPVFAPYLPLGVEQAESACLELVEDEEVFAVVGQVRPPEAALCFSERFGVPFIAAGEGFSADVVERSGTLAINTQPHFDDLYQAMIDMAEEDGALEGATIAVHGRDENEMDRVQAMLEERGYTVATRTQVTAPENDPNAIAQEYDVILELWDSDGVDVVMNAGSSLDVLQIMAAREFYVDVYATGSDAYGFVPDDEAGYEAGRHIAFASGTPGFDESHEETAACFDNWNEGHPDAAIESIDDAWLLFHTCASTELFGSIATAVGPGLTRSAFAESLSAADGTEITSIGTVSLGPDDTSASSAALINQFSEETQSFAPTYEVAFDGSGVTPVES